MKTTCAGSAAPAAWLGGCVTVRLSAPMFLEPDASSQRLFSLPRGTPLSDCFQAGDGFVCCVHEGITGYVPLEYLAPREEAESL